MGKFVGRRNDVWKPAIGGIVGCGIAGSFMKCFTLFYEHIIREFGTDYASVSLINALMYVAYAFASAITPVFLRRFGFRKTTMGLGVIGGITIFISSFGCSVGTLAVFAGLFPGLCLSPVAIQVIVLGGKYEAKYSNLIFQLGYFGFGSVPLAICPLLQLLIDTYGWRGALQVLSGIFLNITVIGALFPTERLTSTDAVDERSSAATNCNDLDDENSSATRSNRTASPVSHACARVNRAVNEAVEWTLFKLPAFWMMVFAYAGMSLAYVVVPSYLIIFGIRVQNLQEIVAATLISGLSVGDAASKLINSFVFYRLSEPGRHIVLMLAFFGLAVMLTIVSFSPNYAFSLTSCIILGLIAGGAGGGLTQCLSDEFQDPRVFLYVNSYINVGSYLLIFLGQVLSGWSIDATGRIQTVFYLGSVFALIPFFLHVVFYLRWKRKHITTVQW